MSIRIPAKVLNQQTRGVLSVQAGKLLWTPDDPTEAEPIEIHTRSITGWQKAKGKPLLRVVASADAVAFEFESTTDRDAVEKALQPFISAASNSSSADDPHAASKQQLLQEDTDLRMMYESLVQTGVLSEQEFWRPRKQLIESGASVGQGNEQSVGLASSLMPDIMDGQEGSDIVNLTSELVQQIFAERPHVKEAFERHVPTDMDEKEFWLKYCKHQDAVKKKRKKIIEGDLQGAQEIDDEFADLFKAQEQEEAQGISADRVTDPTIDLRLDDREAGEGYGMLDVQQRSGQEKTTRHIFGNADIATEINQHAVVVLQGLAVKTSNTPPPREAGHLEGGFLDDLKEEKEETSITLDIQRHFRKERTMHRSKRHRSDPVPVASEPSSILNSQALRSLASASEKVLVELHYGGDVKEEDASLVARGVSPADGLPIEVLDALRSKALVINELLRHFWSSYPVNSYSKQTRVSKLKDTLTTQFESMKSVRAKATSPQQSALIQQLLKPIQAQINAAIDKYTTEQETRQQHMLLG